VRRERERDRERVYRLREREPEKVRMTERVTDMRERVLQVFA
jgi:hypothetical protein